MLEDGARERELPLPRGDWIDFWSGERVRGGGEVVADAPLDRIPVYVRSGSIIVTYPEEHVAAGLGDVPEHERPLEATLWGEPPCGRTGVRLADGTRIRWDARGVVGHAASARSALVEQVHDERRPAEVAGGEPGARVRVVVLAEAIRSTAAASERTIRSASRS